MTTRRTPSARADGGGRKADAHAHASGVRSSPGSSRPTSPGSRRSAAATAGASPSTSATSSPRAGETGIVGEEPLGDIRAAAQRGRDEPAAPLRAVALRGQQRGPGREAEVGGDGALRVRQARRAIGAQAGEGGRVGSSRRPQQLLREPARLIEVEVHHDLLHWRWCSHPVRPSRSPSGTAVLRRG